MGGNTAAIENLRTGAAIMIENLINPDSKYGKTPLVGKDGRSKRMGIGYKKGQYRQ